MIFLQQFHYTMEYNPGKHNSNADIGSGNDSTTDVQNYVVEKKLIPVCKSARKVVDGEVACGKGAGGKGASGEGAGGEGAGGEGAGGECAGGEGASGEGASGEGAGGEGADGEGAGGEGAGGKGLVKEDAGGVEMLMIGLQLLQLT